MRYPEISDWFNQAFIRWQSGQSKRVSITEFGEYLNRSQPTISAYLNGTRKPSYASANEIAKRLDDYSLLDLLGYARPDLAPVPFSSLPPDFLEFLLNTNFEIERTIRDRGIEEYSPEGERLKSEKLEENISRWISARKSKK